MWTLRGSPGTRLGNTDVWKQDPRKEVFCDTATHACMNQMQTSACIWMVGSGCLDADSSGQNLELTMLLGLIDLTAEIFPIFQSMNL